MATSTVDFIKGHMGGNEIVIKLQTKNKTINTITLSHSRVEILAEGRLWLNS